MIPSPRALLGVAPALIVVAGSFVLSRACLRESASRASVSAEPGSEIVTRPSLEDEDRLHRVAIKQETVDDLLDRRISLAEAVERFQTVCTSAEAQANLRMSGGGAREDDQILSQLHTFARVRAAQDPHRFGAGLARLEAEFGSPAGPTRLSN